MTAVQTGLFSSCVRETHESCGIISRLNGMSTAASLMLTTFFVDHASHEFIKLLLPLSAQFAFAFIRDFFLQTTKSQSQFHTTHTSNRKPINQIRMITNADPVVPPGWPWRPPLRWPPTPPPPLPPPRNTRATVRSTKSNGAAGSDNLAVSTEASGGTKATRRGRRRTR